jgi:hypothetical protein
VLRLCPTGVALPALKPSSRTASTIRPDGIVNIAAHIYERAEFSFSLVDGRASHNLLPGALRPARMIARQARSRSLLLHRDAVSATSVTKSGHEGASGVNATALKEDYYSFFPPTENRPDAALARRRVVSTALTRTKYRVAAEAAIIGPDDSEHGTDVSRDGQCRMASASRTAGISGSLRRAITSANSA